MFARAIGGFAWHFGAIAMPFVLPDDLWVVTMPLALGAYWLYVGILEELSA